MTKMNTFDTLPKDPIMMLSVVNTKLRDEYPTLDELCRSMGVDKRELESKLLSVGFAYNPNTNQFN